MIGGGYGNGGGYHEDLMPYSDSELESQQTQMHVTPQLIEIPQNSQTDKTENLYKNGMNKCFDFSKRFEECLKLNFNNTSICSQLSQDLKKCQSNI